jgi:uncharacterized membrane protein
MNNRLMQALGAGIGALTMYFFDPEAGRRRRSLARDQLVRSVNRSLDAIDASTRDLMNRLYGLIAELSSLFTSEEVSDEVLVERVRSTVGRAVRHPGSIEVSANQGQITLSGPILADEVGRLISRVQSVRGVKSVENQLEVHTEPGRIPGLQGEGLRNTGRGRFELVQANWAPATRVVAGTVGSALAIWGFGRRSVLGTAVGATGLTLFARAATNMELKRLIGIGAGRRAVDIQKTLHLDAPVDRVFGLWSEFENFPYFMSNVREVRKTGDNTSHWVVAGPAGTSVEWDAVITSYIPNEVLAWKTNPGSAVQHAGIIHFYPNPDGTTTVDVKLSYNPLAGALGHLVAGLFGADPKSQIDEDLLRMKSFIETGKRPHDAAQESRSTIGPTAGGLTVEALRRSGASPQ